MSTATPSARLRERFPSLRHVGVAAERYPQFISDEFSPHHLDVVLMTFVLSGRGLHQMGEETHEIVAPSVSVTMTGETHSLLTDEGGLDVVNVFIDPELHPLPTLSPPLDEALAALIPLPSAPGVVTTRFAQLELRPADRCEPLLDLLVAETENPRSLDLLAALRTALLATCAHALVGRGLMKVGNRLSASDVRVIEVREWLDHHYRETHALSSLAERARLERTYFSSRFTKVVGMSSSEYVARLRIRYAVGMLQTTDEPIAVISRASGFNDLSNFGRTFRRLVGMSPRQFRTETRALRSAPGGDPRADG